MLSLSVFAKLQPGLFPSFHLRRLPRRALSPLFATHTDSTSCKSFSCDSYENTGDTYRLFPLWNWPLALSIPFVFNAFQTPLHNGPPQLLSFLLLADSSHCNGGVYPLLNTVPSTGESFINWRFDPAAADSGFRSSRVTSHESQVASHCPHNIQPCRGGRS
jgi:hypothetical protein